MTPGPTSRSGRLEAHDEAGARILRIANEGRANALDPGILAALASELQGPAVATARAVLLAGAGERHFSAGLDLADGTTDELAARVREGERLLGAAARAIAGCTRPVVGVLNGTVMGGALELAMACDFRIARAGARLAMPAARLGVVYAPEGLRRFVDVLGPARTRRLFLTGRAVGAEEALALGLVDEVVPDGELWPAALRAAEEIGLAAPLAVEGTRAVIRALTGDGDVAATAAEWRERAFASRDHREALDAFGERRAPEFEGR
jgi:enoyl-CoA hydratase/carnithine racemase